MVQNGYSNIGVKTKVKKELDRRKMNKQAKNGKPVTWDEFLLEATKVGAG